MEWLNGRWRIQPHCSNKHHREEGQAHNRHVPHMIDMPYETAYPRFLESSNPHAPITTHGTMPHNGWGLTEHPRCDHGLRGAPIQGESALCHPVIRLNMERAHQARTSDRDAACITRRKHSSRPVGTREVTQREKNVPPLVVRHLLVPKVGLEPTRAVAHCALNAARLPNSTTSATLFL
jgi:hypothetical protein